MFALAPGAAAYSEQERKDRRKEIFVVEDYNVESNDQCPFCFLKTAARNDRHCEVKDRLKKVHMNINPRGSKRSSRRGRNTTCVWQLFSMFNHLEPDKYDIDKSKWFHHKPHQITQCERQGCSSSLKRCCHRLRKDCRLDDCRSPWRAIRCLNHAVLLELYEDYEDAIVSGGHLPQCCPEAGVMERVGNYVRKLAKASTEESTTESHESNEPPDNHADQMGVKDQLFSTVHMPMSPFVHVKEDYVEATPGLAGEDVLITLEVRY